MMKGSKTHFFIKRGRKHAHGVCLSDAGNIVAFTMPVDAWDNPLAHGLRPMLKDGMPYDVEEAVDAMLRIGGSEHITQAALDLLNSVPRNKEPQCQP